MGKVAEFGARIGKVTGNLIGKVTRDSLHLYMPLRCFASSKIVGLRMSARPELLLMDGVVRACKHTSATALRKMKGQKEGRRRGAPA